MSTCPYDPNCGAWVGHCAGDVSECEAYEVRGGAVAAFVALAILAPKWAGV